MKNLLIPLGSDEEDDEDEEDGDETNEEDEDDDITLGFQVKKG